MKSFSRLFLESVVEQQTDIEGLRNYLSEFVVPYSGELVHGAVTPKLYQELTTDRFWSLISELGEMDESLASMSLNDNVIRLFGSGSGVFFDVNGLSVLRVPTWLVGVTSKEMGMDLYSENEEEIDEMAARFHLPEDRFAPGEYTLPDNFFSDHIKAEAYTMFTNESLETTGGNNEDEVSVDYPLARNKMKVTWVFVEDQDFDTAEEAIAYMEANHSEEELAETV